MSKTMYRRASLIVALLPLLPLAACLDSAGDSCEAGTVEKDGSCVEADASVRLTHLDVRYDLSQPVFVNNRVPVTFGVTAEKLDPASTEPLYIPVAFSFVESNPADPENPLICGSSAINVEHPGDGSEVVVDGFIWPTTLCAQLAGRTVNLQVEFNGGPELAAELDTVFDAPTVTFSAAAKDEVINQECRSSLDGDAGRGCVYELDLELTPSGADGPQVDVRYALSATSSVAIVPFIQSENIGAEGPADVSPTLVVQSRFVVNGRDPYFSAVDPADVPEELIAAEPTILEDLQFGLDAAGVAALSELPGAAEVSYSLLAASDPDTALPLSIRDPEDSQARLAAAAVDHVTPGIANEVVHELFLEDAAREALSAGGIWAGESDFIVRGCFNADFTQSGNAGDLGESLDDCQDIEIVMVHETAASAGASAIDFNKSFERNLGNSRIGISSSMSTQNRLDLTGASSQSEGKVELHGKIGKSFNLTLARGYAEASLNVDPSKTYYDLGLEAFGQSIYSVSDQAATIVQSDDFSVAKSFTIGQLGFGFGPVNIGIKVDVGGTIGFATEDTLEALADTEACQELLQSGESIALCGRMSRVAGPYFGMTGRIEGGINLKLVKAGIGANLQIVTTSFPLEAILGWGLTDDARLLVRGDVNWDMELVPIAGNVYIVGKVGFRRFAKSLKVNLFSFSSPTIKSRLLSQSMAVSEELL
ncbi:hypothetical protein G6O69_06150 [Pseudenhygromyxa sp. WMMC2535]|uniref:hypothetical protein n=1 Tax=Pseudenhygromyxa sp. WMMC2535 TaxID=2712867 RepID=UPI0015527935|nr:hypothetical protein [Pseudenhygromyxa sp. WMMC2535]NVB37406.1 hypothetical protein [Pseudenhygromyxa sp. WMMC2535]